MVPGSRAATLPPLFLNVYLSFINLLLTLLLLFFSCSSFSVCADGSSPAVRDEVKMENGRSPVLGSSLSEPEGTEMMEGAAAAVGRQQSRAPLLPHLPHHIIASDCFLFLCLFSSGSLEFQMPSEGACQQDHTQKSTKKSTVYPADSAELTLSRPPTLHKQPPALPPKPFNRLPNHITGKFIFTRSYCNCMCGTACMTDPFTSSLSVQTVPR